MKKINIIIITLFLLTASYANNKVRIVILHTNDTHSQVEPTDINEARNANMGGYARRMGVIDSIRAAEKHVLLFDAGDYWQGTPYFNFYNGRIEIEAMNRMQYDAATIGNHEFDNGVDTMIAVLREARFPLVVSNYVVENKELRKMLRPFQIIERGGLKIGVFGLGVQPEGLILDTNYKGVKYIDAAKSGRETSDYLRKVKNCDLVICLSHNGYETDLEIARNSSNIDIIIGGHSHTMLENHTAPNADGRPIIIAQVGKSALYLGKIELEFEKKTN